VIAKLMGLPTISPAELQRRLGSVEVIDVNAPQSWTRARVPGARRLDPAGFNAADLPADRAATVVFYCSGPLCRKAPNAARRARQLGWTNVLVMSAGISGWTSASMPTESD
jgi:rhodanese-related sulfurtransferase